MFRSKDFEDGLGQSKPPPPYTEARLEPGPGPGFSDSPIDFPEHRTSGEAWIWVRTLASLVFFGAIVGNLIQHAVIVRTTGQIIVLVGMAVSWLIYFPAAMRAAHQRHEVKGSTLLAETSVLLILVIPSLVTLAMAIVEFHIWQRDGTSGTKFAVETEGKSIKTSMALSSYMVAQSLVWLGGLYALFSRHFENGGSMRFQMSVHSLIRETDS